MDVHVPAAITRALVLRDVDVLTSQLDGTIELSDSDLLDRATELGRVLFLRMKICWPKQRIASALIENLAA
jgi:hypothetical protein